MSRQEGASAAPGSAIRRGAWGLAWLCVALILWSLWRDHAAGGGPWRQGDWLINDTAGPIRRGVFGSALLSLADLTGARVLTVTVLIQAGLFLTAMAILLGVFHRLLRDPLWALLLTSPAFFPLFWAARPEAGMRKELVVYAAMALLFLVPRLKDGLNDGWRSVCAASGLLFVAACAGHEANVFLTPAYAILFVVLVQPNLRAPGFWIPAVLFLGAIAAVFLFAWMHPTVSDPAAVCAPLLARGESGDLCIGAIAWLSYDLGIGQDLLGDLLNKRTAAAFLVAYGLAGLPLLYLIALHDRWRLMLVVTFCLLVPILPLYAVAVDWGRWLSLHVVSAGLVLAAMAWRGDVERVREPRTGVVAAICLLNLVWVPDHVIGVVPGGLVRELGVLTGAIAPPPAIVPVPLD